MKRGKKIVFCISLVIIVFLVSGVSANEPFPVMNAQNGLPFAKNLETDSEPLPVTMPENPNPMLTAVPAPQTGPDEVACSCTKRLPSETSGCGSDPASCVCKKNSSAGLFTSSSQGLFNSREIVADCSQSNALDSGGCCCWIPDPTHAHNYGHVLDLGVIVTNPSVSFDIQPGCGDCGCITTGYYYYSEDGIKWERFWSESNLRGWQLYSRSAVIMGNVRYLRANTDGCSVDYARVRVLVSDEDLSPGEFSAVTQSDVIDGIRLYWAVENRGTGKIEGNWTDAVYLSKDQSLDAGDIRLSLRMVNRSLSPGESYPVSETIDYKTPVQDGMYYLILRTDNQNEVREFHEGNNVMFRPVHLGPAETFHETAIHQSTFTEDLEGKDIRLDNGPVTGDLAGTFNLTSGEGVTVISGSFKGQGFFKGIISATLDSLDYSGMVKGVMVPDPENKKIVLKGTLSGNDLNGLIDGYLTESVPGSGNYDLLNATWKLNWFGGKNHSVVLDSKGTVRSTALVNYPSTNFQLMQTTLNGDVSGHYNEPVTMTVNHVTIADTANPYNGKGFATLSYVSSYGQGEGWLATREMATGVHDIQGMFSEPLGGIATGSITSSSPRAFSIAVERTDLGLPPMADLDVKISGPERISPGQMVTYLLEVRNYGNAAANSVVVVDALPQDMEYVSSSDNGIFRPENHEVFWVFDSVVPSSVRHLYITTKMPWGIPNGEVFSHRVAIETLDNERNNYQDYRSSICGLDQYILLKKTINAPYVDLIGTDLDLIHSDTSYQDLLMYAVARGYTDTNYTSRKTLSDGTELILTFLIKSEGNTLDSTAFLTKYMDPSGVSSGWMLYEQTNSTISLYDKDGGILLNIDDQSVSYLGTWNIKDDDPDGYQVSALCPRGACRANCWKSKAIALIIGCTPADKLKYKNWDWSEVAQNAKHGYNLIRAYQPCNVCQNDPSVPLYKKIEVCRDCAKPLLGLIPGFTVWSCGANLIDQTARCELLCRNQQTFEGEVKEFVACNPGNTRNSCGKYWNLNNYYGDYFSTDPVLIKETCNSACEWQQTEPQWCKGGSCLSGSGEDDSKCGEQNENGDQQTGTVTAARDPNVKTGREGRVFAGDRMDYRVEFENEGEGIAYGVYFTDTLDDDLNDATLTTGPVFSTADQSMIAPAGVYNPATRTITWTVGEVGSKKGGYANYSINIRGDAPDNTEVINSATVYFPSVPETTRTNAIVSIVGYNRLPVMDWMGYFSLNATEPFELRVNATDADEDLLKYHGISIDGSNLPNGAVFDENTGVFRWTPALNQTGLYELRFSVSDWKGSVHQDVTLQVTQKPVPLPGYTLIPTDPDNDGIYEDLNGNTRLDFADVVLYFNQMEWIAENEPVSAFDLNGNGRIDFADIVRLFSEI